MSPGQIWQMGRQAVSAWSDDYAASMGAALAYYTTFSIAPLLIIVIAIAGAVFGHDAAQGHILAQLRDLLGKDGALAIEWLLKSASDPQQGMVATVISVVTLVIGATTVFGELQTSLDRIWQAPAATRPEGLWALLRTRLLAFGMVLGIAFLLLVSLVLSAVIAALGEWWSPWFGERELLAQAANFIAGFVLITAAFALIYKLLPRARIAWRDVWTGAAITALLFSIGKLLIGLYLGKSSTASAFGAAGSFVVLLVWVYYSAQIFFLGAEFTWVYAHAHGSRRGEPRSRPAPAPGGRELPQRNRPAGPAVRAPAGAGAQALGPLPDTRFSPLLRTAAVVGAAWAVLTVTAGGRGAGPRR
ncbi:MAG TPA: YihY/virulence factor BrkB family protein [Plasticicumulans sp.]|nr:YihY/virulence factor BrkB family protein [Plasticicumulans sp.]